jgi:cytochrome c5
MKKLLSLCITFSIIAFIAACGGSDPNNQNTGTESTPATGTETSSGAPAYDPNRGEGKFKDVMLADKLDATLAANGKKAYDIKCSSCHKLSDERLVGPGWKGVTERNQPAWIMNFVTNTDAMIDKDPKVQAQLEICLVRMPNQSVSDDDARALLEFMRENDGVK